MSPRNKILGLFIWSQTMPSPRRADHTWAKVAYNKAKKIIYAQQSVCGICGRPVDKKLPFPNPWSPTIDHIIPVQKGGDPVNLENLQLAHLACNRAKSTKLVTVTVKEKSVSNRDLPLSCDWSKI